MRLLIFDLCVSLIFTWSAVLTASIVNESIKVIKPVDKKDDVCDILTDVNGFSFDMQKKVSEDNKNMIFSPFSIYFAVAMLSTAARGNSKDEIISALKWDNSNRIEKLKLLTGLHSKLANENLSGDVKIQIVNNGWISDEIRVLKSFQSGMKAFFNVTLGLEDFEKYPEISRNIINDWVSDHTGGLINDLFPEDSIKVDTKLVLANAIYFKGSWKMPFDEDDTTNGVFFNSDGTEIENVPFMHQTTEYKTVAYRNVRFLEMPYQNDTFSMLFAMPMAYEYYDTPAENDITNVTALINEMDDLLLKESLSRLENYGDIEVYVPKFKIKQGLELNSHLQSLGINDVFDMATADLSGIDGRREVYVSSAVHKAFVQVDEKGTKAAAATGISILGRMMVITPVLRFNHPFLFFILNKECNAIIFAGKIVNPLG